MRLKKFLASVTMILGFLLLPLMACAQLGPPITVGPTPVFIYSPGRATSVTVVQTAGTSAAYVIYSVNRAVLANKTAASVYTFVPSPPATNFTLGEPVGMISISFGTATFRATAVNPGAGVTSLNGLTGSITLAAGTGISIIPSGNTFTFANTGILGTIAATQVAFGTAPNTIGGDPSFLWDNVNHRLTVATGSAGTTTTPVSIRGTGSGAFTPANVTSLAELQLAAANNGYGWVLTREGIFGSSGKLSSLSVAMATNGVSSITGGNIVGDGTGNFTTIYFAGIELALRANPITEIGFVSTDAPIKFLGFTSGSSTIGVAQVAGTPARINLPTTTGTAGQVLSTNGATPQQTSWITPASGITGLTTGFLPKAGSATTIVNSLCDEGITTANTFNCSNTAGAHFVSVSTGTSPPVITAGTGGVMGGAQGTTPTGFAAGADWLWENSALNCMDLINNGVERGCLVTTSTVAPSFTSITSGTNTTAAMVVGTGASLTATGTGSINATLLNGATFAAPGAIGGTTPAAITATTYSTAANCAVNSVSPAACGSAAAGAFVVPTTTTAYTVNTSAVTAASRIMLQAISFASNLPSAPTCVTPLVGTTDYTVSAIVAGTSFSIALQSTVGTTCFEYTIIN